LLRRSPPTAYRSHRLRAYRPPIASTTTPLATAPASATPLAADPGILRLVAVRRERYSPIAEEHSRYERDEGEPYEADE